MDKNKMSHKTPGEAKNSLAHNLDSASQVNGPHLKSHYEQLKAAVKRKDHEQVRFHLEHAGEHLEGTLHDIQNARLNAQKIPEVRAETARLDALKAKADPKAYRRG